MMADSAENKIPVKAPLAGTFYRSSSPDAPPYAEVGQVVEKGQVLALLESMKVFVKVKSPSKGKIVETLVNNEQIVSLDDVLFFMERI